MKIIAGGELLDLLDDGDFMAEQYEITASNRVVFFGEWILGGTKTLANLEVITLEDITEENIFTVEWDEMVITSIKKTAMKIYDFELKQYIECKVLSSIQLEEAELLLVEYGGIEFAVVLYSTGEYFTPRDWQGFQPKIMNKIEEIQWVDKDGFDAIVVNGLPRLMPFIC